MVSDSIAGVLIFNQAHAVITPLYLALHLFTSPMASYPSPEAALIDVVDLEVLPLSFILAFVFPICLVALPAPSVVSVVFKQTAIAWYQQWNLYIAFTHFLLATTRRQVYPPPEAIDLERSTMLLRSVYGFVFIMGALPHMIVMVLSCTAGFWPSLFAKGTARVLHPRNLLTVTSPFSRVKARDLAQGIQWLIQWDHVIGTASMIVWATTLYMRTKQELGLGYDWSHTLWRIIMYAFGGGPVGAAVGLLWERDELLLNVGSLNVEKRG